MGSREEIFAKLRKNTKKIYDYPEWTISPTTYEDTLQKFIDMSREVGGQAVVLKEGEDINEVISSVFPNQKRVASNMPEISLAHYNPDEVEMAAEMNGTDMAVVEGEMAVAENGAVWIPQRVANKAIYFIPERLVIVVPKENVVNNMHEAYERIDSYNYCYSTFISGPSKTADIEQALVMGAHGPREVLVVLR